MHTKKELNPCSGDSSDPFPGSFPIQPLSKGELPKKGQTITNHHHEGVAT